MKPRSAAIKRPPRTTKPGKGSERVKAWIYAVINPWSEALAFEVDFLESKSVSYRWRTDQLEHLRPVRSQLAPAASLVLQDLIRYARAVAAWERAHDEQVGAVRKAASEFFHDLVARNEGLSAALKRAMDRSPDEAKSTEVNPATLLKIVAEHVVNDCEELSSDYSDARFWNKHRLDFLECGWPSALGDRLVRQRIVLADADRGLLGNLAALRDELVEDFDVPPAHVG